MHCLLFVTPFLIVACLCAKSLQSCLTPWTAAHQVPLSVRLSRQEYWNGLPFPPPGDLPDPKIEPASHWQVDSLPLSHQGNPKRRLLGELIR